MSASLNVCRHCGVPSSAPFCCTGCEAAHALLSGKGLERFYALQDGAGLPVGEAATSSTAWLERLLEEQPLSGSITLDVEGIHCAGCVWLIQTLFQKKPGAVEIVVNPTRGQLKARTQASFPWIEFITELGTLGYRTGPGVRGRDRAGDGLLIRFGVAVALAMNAMILSGAFYFGLEQGDELHDVFLVVGLVLSTLSVLVGLPVFARGVWQAAKQRMVHLDLPIALGIVLTYVGSLVAAWQQSGAAGYFDTLSVFIALVLFGRLVQRRGVQRNRRRVLEQSEAGGLTVRKEDGALVLAEEIRAGDVMTLAPGDCLVVDAILLDDARGLVSAWTTGEPDARDEARGTSLVAGTQNQGEHAVRVRAERDFSASTLVGLLELPDEDDARDMVMGRKIAGPYVALVVGLAAIAILFFSLEVAIGILVVTCPCALGLALPLAREGAVAELAARGLFVRRASVLERVLEVRACAFDKTGTLTAAALVADDDTVAGLSALSDEDRAACRAMVSSSGHPKSRALLCALGEGPRLAGIVREVAGVGLSLDGYTFGQTFMKDARVLLRPEFCEGRARGGRAFDRRAQSAWSRRHGAFGRPTPRACARSPSGWVSTKTARSARSRPRTKRSLFDIGRH